MKKMTYCIYREDEFFVAQCLNVDVSSFGCSREEALANLREAVELRLDEEADETFASILDASVGEELIHA